MIEIKPITLATARQLVDFAGRSAVAEAGAAAQLEGAVAVHNLLAGPHRVAYLADEVGMGKTYVALGATALLRHFHPQLRVLYIVPRENLQLKWYKEIRNFTANNWRLVDHRVKSFQGTPVVEPVVCDNLLDLVRAAALDAHRDFILRLSSFSLPLSRRDGGEKWKEKAERLHRIFPGLADKALQVDGRIADCHERRKDAFACAVNEVLPHFDLLVLDEGHKLKHGFQDGDGSARNRLLAYVLGTKSPDGRSLIRRIDRAVILSATPVDNSFCDLWNQLDLLELAGPAFAPLQQEDADEHTRQAAAQCLIRRLTHITVGGEPRTRNRYRREWRRGGVTDHDQPLEVPSDLQRLIVALMQRRLADVLAERARDEQESSARSARSKRFSRSFQIGMLASFESFQNTAKMPADDGTFDQSEQTEDPTERQGVDTQAVNSIARSYRHTFADTLPHPKMNAVVDDLWRGMLAGRKTLVFVRRIHSVPEMMEKLTKKYSDWLAERLRTELSGLPKPERQRMEEALDDYKRKRMEFYSRDAVSACAGGREPSADDMDEAEAGWRTKRAEPSGFESLFSWFFRGQGPPGISSGASLSANRLEKSTFFDDNWLLWLLEYPSDPLDKLARLCGVAADQLSGQLRRRAREIQPGDKVTRRQAYLAYQRAALERIAERATDPSLAGVVLDQYGWRQPRVSGAAGGSFPGPQRFLGMKTFFTELAQRQELCDELWPGANRVSRREPELMEQDFLEREQRRLLMSSAIRLGHPMIDLWLVYTRLTGSLTLGRADEEADDVPTGAGQGWEERLVRGFADLLDQQRASPDEQGPTSFMELHRLAGGFPLLADVNFHDMRDRSLNSLPSYFADQLSRQQPIAGMYQTVSKRTVHQFRMPGYPYVLITTDVLQEGEDLHTFCDRIMHYGISWTSSATEQRIGRVDRVGSLAQRRLADPSLTDVADDDLLQVYFPYLCDTYEYVQVREVFKRLNRFLEMLHDLRGAGGAQDGKVDVETQILESSPDVFQPYSKQLISGFEIQEALKPEVPLEPLLQSDNDQILQHFACLVEDLSVRFAVEWRPDRGSQHRRAGKAFIWDGQLLRAGEPRHESHRQQPFSLVLRTTHGGKLLLRCISPIGPIRREQLPDVFSLQRTFPHLKFCAEPGDAEGHYHLCVQTDLLFSAEITQPEEFRWAVEMTLTGADELEDKLFGNDHPEDELSVWD